MKQYKLKAAPTAISQEQKGPKGSKAKRILIGVDAHLESYQAASKIANGAVGVARSLVSHLFNYLNGNEQALQLVRVPTQAQEQARLASRQHDALVQERKRLGAMGNSLLLSQGYGSWKNWWRRKSFERLSQVLSSWVVELLNTWVDLLRALDEKIQQAKVSLAKQCQGPRPKGVGAPSLRHRGAECLDWKLSAMCR